MLDGRLTLDDLHRRYSFIGARSHGAVYEDFAWEQMSSIIYDGEVKKIIREPSKRCAQFPFLVACPDFIVEIE